MWVIWGVVLVCRFSEWLESWLISLKSLILELLFVLDSSELRCFSSGGMMSL